MFSNMQVTDDLDKNSSGGVKAVFEWTQERIREEPEPVCVCVYEREGSGGALYATAPHMPSMLPDLPTHLGVFQPSVPWKDVLFTCCSYP